MLIDSFRHKPDDLSIWREHEEADRQWWEIGGVARKAERAAAEIVAFADAGLCYCGVSWGKDSVVVAHLISQFCQSIPCYWVVVQPIENPDCESVEQAFLRRWPLRYQRIIVGLQANRGTSWRTSEEGFAEAARRTADRHISGIRGGESSGRNLRMARHGISTDRTCAPIGWWSARDVFAYLAHHDLPVHPVYAMLGGGRWDRERLRVASLGGRRGRGVGRGEWEREYYGDMLRRHEWRGAQ